MMRKLALGVAMSLIVASCGSSETSSPTAAPATTAAPAATTAAPAPAAADDAAPATVEYSAAELAAAGKAAAEAAGGPVELPQRTVGFLRYVSESTADQRLAAALRQSAEVLGWGYLECDAQGDPSQFDTCGTSLLNQGADAMFTDTVPPTGFPDTLSRANDEGIPFVNFGGMMTDVECAMFDACYYPDETALGTTLSDHLVTLLSEGDQMAIWGFPQFWADTRVQPFRDRIAEEGIDLVEDGNSDPANIVGGSQNAWESKLIQFPDLVAIWVTYDAASYGVATAVATQYPGASFPDRPYIGTFYANQPTLDLMRQGRIDAVSETALEWSVWVALDQVATNAARGADFSMERQPTYEGIQFDSPVLVTADNLPPAGEPVPPGVDYVSFFTAKWNAEFDVK